MRTGAGPGETLSDNRYMVDNASYAGNTLATLHAERFVVEGADASLQGDDAIVHQDAQPAKGRCCALPKGRFNPPLQIAGARFCVGQTFRFQSSDHGFL